MLQRANSLAVLYLLLSCCYHNVAAAPESANFVKLTTRALSLRGGRSESAEVVPEAESSRAVTNATEAVQEVAASTEAEDVANQPSEPDKQPSGSDPPQRRRRKRASDAPANSSAAAVPELQPSRFYRTMVRSATGRVIVASALLTVECCKVSLHFTNPTLMLTACARDTTVTARTYQCVYSQLTQAVSCTLPGVSA
jgi:hypothetical protein